MCFHMNCNPSGDTPCKSQGDIMSFYILKQASDARFVFAFAGDIYPKTAISQWKETGKNIWGRYLEFSLLGSRPFSPCTNLPVDNLKPSSGIEIISFSTRRRNRSQILHHKLCRRIFPSWGQTVQIIDLHTVNQPRLAWAVICQLLHTTPRKPSVNVRSNKYSVSRHSDETNVNSDVVSLQATIFLGTIIHPVSIKWFSRNKLSSFSINRLNR